MDKVIRINDNSKGHLCCSASIDLTIGCNNMCVGCYGLKASRLGKAFHTESPTVKVYDEDIFKKDCRKYRKRGITNIRVGKFSDPGSLLCLGVLDQVIAASGEEGMHLVVVTKSLGFRDSTAEILKQYNHTLHISLGMESRAPDNIYRYRTYRNYKAYGVDVKCRIVEDVTRAMPEEYRRMTRLPISDTLITPMRYSSKDDLSFYRSDISKYEFKNGYYRPTELHADWIPYTNVCGEIGNCTICSDCLVPGGQHHAVRET